jgi:hypothetical protein
MLIAVLRRNTDTAVIVSRQHGRRGDLVTHENYMSPAHARFLADAPGLLRRTAPRNDKNRIPSHDKNAASAMSTRRSSRAGGMADAAISWRTKPLVGKNHRSSR